MSTAAPGFCRLRLRGSKKMRGRSQEPEADQGTGEVHERLVDLAGPIGAQAQLAEAMEPRHRALDHPADFAQATAVRRPLLRDERLDVALAQLDRVMTILIVVTVVYGVAVGGYYIYDAFINGGKLS